MQEAAPHAAADMLVQGKAAAAGVAAINSLGSVGGAIGPYLLGVLQVCPRIHPCVHQQLSSS